MSEAGVAGPDRIPMVQRSMLAMGCISLKLFFVLQISTWQFCGSADVLKITTCPEPGFVALAFFLVLFSSLIVLWYLVTHRAMSGMFSRAIRMDTAVSLIFITIGYSYPEHVLVKGWIWILVGWYMAILLSAQMSNSRSTKAIHYLGVLGLAVSSLLHYVPDVQQHDYLTLTTLFSMFVSVASSDHGGQQG